MKYGLIGEKLGHSFSKDIHERLSDYGYEPHEIARENFDKFARERDFLGINVTIPYKQQIIPYLDYIDDVARDIGAVNTVVNVGGALRGYNTDFYGMDSLISRLGIDISQKKVAILGTGGTSSTAMAVAKARSAGEILKVSRSGRGGAVTYEELYEKHRDIEVIINTTPSGMFPNIFDSAIDISGFDRLIGVIDAIYNPLRTPLVMAARERGIAAEGGLYMLVGQAVRASEIFLGKEYPNGTVDGIYEELRAEKENIVLIGMPSSGKSTVGAILAKKLGRKFIDTDELVEKIAGSGIPDIISTLGEKKFRDIEAEACAMVAMENSAVIATGGGAILREENVRALKENGRLYFIDRPIEKLIPTSSRPLSSTREAIEKRYNERYGIYTSVCDARIDADTDAVTVAERILENFKK